MHASLVRKVNIGTSQKVVFSYNIKAPQTMQEFIFHTNIDWSDGKTPNNSNRYQMPTHNNSFFNYWWGTQFRRFAENDPLQLVFIRSWISELIISSFLSDVIIHPCPNFNGGPFRVKTWMIHYIQWPLLLTWFNLIPGWKSNYIRYRVWDEITYPFANFKYEGFGNAKYFHPTLYNACDYLSTLGLKLNHVSKRDPSSLCQC